MQKVNINLNEELLDKLDERADQKGISRSELIRRLLDQALEVKEREVK